MASSTASLTKFSEAISSRPSCWRRTSLSIAEATSGSTSSSRRYIASFSIGISPSNISPILLMNRASADIELEAHRIGNQREACFTNPLNHAAQHRYFASSMKANLPIGCRRLLPLNFRNLLDPLLMPAAGEIRVQPAVNNLTRRAFVQHAAANGKDVGVIVLTAQARLDL